MLSRDQILAKQGELPTAEVPVPEWGDGETVRVRGLTSRARFDWASASQKAAAGEPAPEPTAYLVVLSAIDENGARLFPQTQDVDAVAELSADVVNRIAEKVMDLSGLGDKAAKDAEGKSEASPSGDSPTGSPETSAAPSPS